MYQNLIQSIIKILKQIVLFMEKQIVFTEKNEQLSISLAPKIIIDPIELKTINPYLDSLKKAINTEGINNIAITGSYGSGKSTILKTFKHHNNQFKYLSISLASFKGNKKDKNEFERTLEVSILQQIFYHVEPNKIPDSRFKRIINTTTRKLVLQTLFVVSWVVSILILFKFDLINKLNPSSWELYLKIDWVAVLLIIIFLTGIGFFVKNLVRLFSNSKITKLNIKGEIELGETNNKSVFNQHLEEVLYFFERTNFNVVIIEDLDRFKSTDIFTKLREINILINNSNQINRKISFIYAIKDEIFKDSNNRVKFFEFIIPIIPFVNPSNAGEQLTKLITSSNLTNELSSDFVHDVTTFINDIDMRLLINIFLEYLLYKEKLVSVVNHTELFAIIIYKNIFPKDFGNLSKGRGQLFEFFSNKSLYSNTLITGLNNKINELEIENSNINKENLNSTKELRHVYISELISLIPNVATINAIEVKLLIEDDNFKTLFNNKNNIAYQSFTPSKSYPGTYELNDQELDININQIEKRVNTQFGYFERESQLQSKIQNKIEFNKSEIEKLKKQINQVKLLNVKEIFEKVNIDDYLNKFKDNLLVRNLLINGYINENYNDYISIFHEVNLTKADFDFERKVKSGVILPFEFELSNIENIIKRLAQKYFYREAILNYTLLDNLIKIHSKYPDKYNTFFEFLNKDNEKTFQFISGYLERKTTNIPSFLNKLINTKHNYIAYLISKSNIPNSEIEDLIILIFNHAEIDDINNQSDITILIKWFNQINNFCEYSVKFSEPKKLQAFFITHNIIINQLDIPKEQSHDNFSFIISNNLYLITASNLFVILNWISPSFSENEFQISNYTLLKKEMSANVLDYIMSNISLYVKNVLLNLPENKLETEESIVELLNCKSLSADLKTDFIQSQNLKITSLNSIEEIDDVELVLRSNKIQPTWKNIFEYYDYFEESSEINDILIDFFNVESNYSSLAHNKLSVVNEKDEDLIKKFSLKLIYCDRLELTAYTNILKSIPFKYNSLHFDKLNKQKIQWMISNRFINLTQSNFERLKTIDVKIAISLIEVYENNFIQNLTDFTLENSDWILIFNSELFTYTGKLKIIETIDNMIIIQDNNIADIVCNLIPNNELIPLKYEVLEAMFNSHKSLQKRIEILNLHFKSLEKSKIQTLIEKLGVEYARIFIKQNRPSIENTPYNLNLVEKLNSNKFISSYSISKSKNKINIIAKYSD